MVAKTRLPILRIRVHLAVHIKAAAENHMRVASQHREGDRSEVTGHFTREHDRAHLERWNAARRKPALRQMGVDEIYLGRKQKFLSVVCNPETGEPLRFGQERKQEILDGFFQTELSAQQRRGIQAACLCGSPIGRASSNGHPPNCQIIYDKFHIMQHVDKAVDEVRRAEFFRKGGRMRNVVRASVGYY